MAFQDSTPYGARILRLVGDDARRVEQPGRSTPPLPGHPRVAGQQLRDDWFAGLR